MDGPESIKCLNCAAENPADAERCAHCGRPPDVLVIAADDPYASPSSEPAPRLIGPDNPYAPPAVKVVPAKLHIGTLMLMIAVIAVCLGLLIEVPGVGVLMLIVLTPALVRTALAVARRRAKGRPMSWDDRLLAFISSVGVMLAVWAGAIVAFGVTCYPIAFVGSSVSNDLTIALLAIPVGIIAAIAAGVVLIRRLWPRKD